MKNEMEHLHPGYKWEIRLRVFFRLLIFFIFIVIWMIPTNFSKGAFDILTVLAIPIIIYLLIIETYARMSYNRWKYKFEQDSLRIENGIIWKKYVAIPYERIQNVDIKRGIIARILGFSTVDIETAGRSGETIGGIRINFGNKNRRRYRSEGHLPAVSTEAAEKISEFILKKINKK